MNELYDRLWGEGYIHPFGCPAVLEQFMNNKRRMIKIKGKEIHVPDCVSLHDLAIFLIDYPEGEYKILIHEFNENTDIER